jgi:hypothetical protein
VVETTRAGFSPASLRVKWNVSPLATAAITIAIKNQRKMRACSLLPRRGRDACGAQEEDRFIADYPGRTST